MSPIRYVELGPDSPAFAGPVFYFLRSLELEDEESPDQPAEDAPTPQEQ